MSNMAKTAEIIICILFATGAIEISYVESRIISKTGAMKLSANSLREIYWLNLSVRERWIFWTGLILLASPFLFVIAR